jgi:hypothetical protein
MSTPIKALMLSAAMAVLVAITYAQTAPTNPATPEATSSLPEREGSGAAKAQTVPGAGSEADETQALIRS